MYKKRTRFVHNQALRQSLLGNKKRNMPDIKGEKKVKPEIPSWFKRAHKHLELIWGRIHEEVNTNKKRFRFYEMIKKGRTAKPYGKEQAFKGSSLGIA